MKQRATTIEGVRFEPGFFYGYTGAINGRRVVAYQLSERDWVVKLSRWGFGGRIIGGGRTLREAVRMAKERIA